MEPDQFAYWRLGMLCMVVLGICGDFVIDHDLKYPEQLSIGIYWANFHALAYFLGTLALQSLAKTRIGFIAVTFIFFFAFCQFFCTIEFWWRSI